MNHATGNRVVITGIGVESAAGSGWSALAGALREGRGCASPIDTPLPVSLAARCPVTPTPLPDFPDDRKAWLAMRALDEALSSAQLEDLDALVTPTRRGVFLGTGLSSVTEHELVEDIYPHLRADGSFDRAAMARDLSRDRAAPRRHMAQRTTTAVAARVGALGATGTSTSACSAAAQAIAEGLWAVRRGELDMAVVGGQDAMIHPLGVLSFVVLGAVSPGACRPFDHRRDGFVIGEGAAMLVIESEALARRRGAPILAVLAGAGTSADAWNPTAPHPRGDGAERAMRRALRDAGVHPADVDYINAHGTGTPVGDRAEALAVARVFGPDTLVSSVKGAIGHCVAAAGALEAAVCVAALREGWLPGTAGFEQPDPDLPLTPLGPPREQRVNWILSNSFGFGGQNGSLVLASPEVALG